MIAATERALRTAHGCGPLSVSALADSDTLIEKSADLFSLYTVAWPAQRRVEIVLESRRDRLADAAGSYLTCVRTHVDAMPGGLRASTTLGASARCYFDDDGEFWKIGVPHRLHAIEELSDLEDLLLLALTTGWRRGGWVPIHAGAVHDGSRTALFCAASGGGKSTLTAAFVRRGWKTLGDDKLLLRSDGGRPTVAALKHTFNLDPRTRGWFPEVGDLSVLPTYSAWTQKRRVGIDTIWPAAGALNASPTHLVMIARHDGPQTRIIPLDRGELLEMLLRQTVIPADPKTARMILGTVAAAAMHMHGVRVEMGEGAYDDPAWLDELDAALQ